jgi:prepilin-type N-terminal cleavage/methylation domain-containing protein
MLNKIKNRKQEGFTIIEVLIVLAIAGLIMLIVFLAVPALQRNSRNTQRSADASKVAAAVSQCMANRNGVVASCSSNVSQLTGAGGLDTPALQQLVTVAPGAGFPGNATSINWSFSHTCGADGATVAGGTARQAVVLYNTETATGIAPRCLSV